MYKDRKRINKNGYVVVEYPEHPKAFDTGSGVIGVYEHVLIAEEEVLGRDIKEGEVVHHLNFIRNDNSPNNLLVLSNPMHTKLHMWLNKHNIELKEEFKEESTSTPSRCKCCDKPINKSDIYCSHECYNVDQRRYVQPDKETLTKLVWEKPTSEVSKIFGVSDVAISKLCKKLGVEKPSRGYWTKVKFDKEIK